MDDRWQRVKALFQAAAEQPIDRRDPFLDAQAGDDEALRAEVRSLLSNDSTGGSFLDRLPTVRKDLLGDLLPCTLSPGLRVGPYEIIVLIGSGAMGEVYRARDTKLNRDVALKVLPELFAGDADRMARFRREAFVLATLNHPNIARIYGLEESNGVAALVLELADGPTLAERLAHGPLALEDTLPIARQITEALEAAHEQSIIHRDLKPANITTCGDGMVKVLDFGLAKISDGADSRLSRSPKLTATDVHNRTLLGTPTYMSPEQVRGRSLDRRTDIWSFGCVLYEMLTGRPPFVAETVSDTLAAVLEHDIDQTAIPADTPPPIRRLLRRCLEKDREKRLDSAASARLDIDDATTPSAAEPFTMPSATRWTARRPLVGAAIGMALIAGATIGYVAAARVAHEGTAVVRFDLPPPPGLRFERSLAISPDGHDVVAVATTTNGLRQLWLRRLDDEDGRLLAGTEGALYPFWAPDSRAIGFFADGKLKRIDVRGLSAISLCDAPAGRGGAWTADEQIVFAPDVYSGLMRVPAAGGDPAPLTNLVADRGETSHRFPFPLPDRKLIYFIEHRNAAENGVWLVALDDPQHAQRIVRSGQAAQFAGHSLIFVAGGTLLAQQLNTVAGRLVGDPRTIVTNVASAGVIGQDAFSVSNTDSLLVRRNAFPLTQLAWTGRDGHVLEWLGEVGHNFDPRLSPDGHHLAYMHAEHGVSTLWVLDLDRHTPTRLVSDLFHAPDDRGPGWSEDGNRIVFSSHRGPAANANLYVISPADGHVAPFAESLQAMWFAGWTQNGLTALWTEGFYGLRAQVVVMGPDRKPTTYYDPGYMIEQATVSPNGRLIAFTSNHSGSFEVFVIGFPVPGVPRQLSIGGGTQPRLRGDGKELFFLAPDSKLMALTVNASEGNVTFGRPEPLFEASIQDELDNGVAQYDVTSDGRRFLINVVREASISSLTVMLNTLHAEDRR
jgi:hypothetical protein